MEKPAVVFNEAGFKMFVDLIRDLSMANGAKQPVDNDLDKSKADALVRAYFERDDKPDLTPKVVEHKPNTMYNMDEVATVISSELCCNVGINYDSSMLSAVLKRHGFDYSPKGVPPVMRSAMMRYEGIQKVEPGIYTWNEGVNNEE
jgi:hypothetical protein